MAVRKLKPVTPGQRHKVIGTFEDITASVPEKSLVYGKRSTGGRNNTGKMTVRYIGGGHKKKYRSMIQTVQLASRFFSTQMVKNVTLLLQTDLRWVQRLCLVQKQFLR